jgi:DNA repair exonuclease SbcCD ATPase subunit
MILRSVEIRGWKCFAQPTQVGPFVDGLNVVHAPNASGKSTLFDALRRGLFDEHRVSGRDVEALRPWGRDLAPAIEIEFGHAGEQFRLKKCFLDRQLAELSREEEGAYVLLAEGDAASRRVREMLCGASPGRGLTKAIHWGLTQVLWAPQGQLTMASLSRDVVASIQESLGAQVGSTGTGPLAQRIEKAYGQLFTDTGKYRGGKDAPLVVQFDQQRGQLLERRQRALSQREEYDAASRQVEDLAARREQVERQLQVARKDHTASLEQQQSQQVARHQRSELVKEVERAAAEHRQIQQRIEELSRVRTALEAAKTTQRTLAEQLPAHEQQVKEYRRHTHAAEQQVVEARAKRDAHEQVFELAEHAEKFCRCRSELAKLASALERVEVATRELAALKQRRAGLVAPDSAGLKSLRAAARARDDARIRLEAALITVEVIPTSPIELRTLLGDVAGVVEATPESPAIVRGAPEVRIELPGGMQIRARGPATSADELRQQLQQAEAKWQQLALAHGSSDLEELERRHDQAKQWDQEIAAQQAAVETLSGGKSLETMRGESARWQAVLAQLQQSHPEWLAVPPEPEALLAAAKLEKQRLNAAIADAETELRHKQQAQVAADTQWVERRAQQRAVEDQVRLSGETLARLSGDGLSDRERQDLCEKRSLEWSAAQAQLRKLEQELGPAFHETEGDLVERLTRECDALTKRERELADAQNVAFGHLQRLSREAPYSQLAEIDEQLAVLDEQLARERTRTEAIRLLYQLVQQARQDAVAAVARPVEEVATRTLARIAGGRLGTIHLAETFEPARVAPRHAETQVALDHLSGGENEQVHLAVRLALGEVLSRGQRQLVVLDDVLTATDAGRLRRIHSILEEVAERLQIVVLTCHPERYQALAGAHYFDLDQLARRAHATVS